MAPSFSEIFEEARLSARALLDYGEHFFNPTVRLGVTGLSRAGKTVFITALIHGLTRGGRFPIFEPYALANSDAVRGPAAFSNTSSSARRPNGLFGISSAT